MEPEQPVADLGQAALDFLRVDGQEVSFADGEIVVRRGDAGASFYVVMAGAVEVVLQSDEGQRLPLARLGPGTSFGEMSVLTHQPTSADVVSHGPSTVLVYPAHLLREAIERSSEVRNHILTKLINDLRRTTVDVWLFSQRSRALGGLISRTAHTGPIVAESPCMQHTAKRLREFADLAEHLLITGDHGTGKLFAARTVHEAGSRPTSPFIAADCLHLPPGEAKRVLFGTVNGNGDRGEGRKAGLQLMGAVHLAHGGTLVLQHVEGLEPEAQETLLHYLEGSLADQASRCSTRVIATTSGSLTELARDGRFLSTLASRLESRSLGIPRLRDRKRDILPLARLFLTERCQRAGGTDKQFSLSAEQAIVSVQYRHRNVAELRETVESAAFFAEDDQIRAEHIFSGPKDQTDFAEYDVTRTTVVDRLLTGPALVLGRIATFLGLMSVAVICLVEGSTPAGKLANTIGWAVWWPSLLVAFLIAGRIWCTVCPFSATGRAVSRIFCLRLVPPNWLRRNSGWLVALMFVVFIWTEKVLDMTANPAAAGTFLLALMAVVVVSSVIFDREVWCRYLCPLGGLAAGFSVAAALHLRARPEICGAKCTTHSCLKGSDRGTGCPVFHHPVYAREGHYCKLCLDCLSTCPHGATGVYLRPPLWSIWGLNDVEGGLVPCVLVVFFLALVMLASQRPGFISTPPGFTVAVALAIGSAAFMRRRLPTWLSGETEPDPAILARVSICLLVLAWGPLMAFHLEHVPGLALLRLGLDPAALPARILPLTELSVMRLLQILVVAVGAFAAALALWRTRVAFLRRGRPPMTLGWRLVQCVFVGYLVVALTLICRR